MSVPGLALRKGKSPATMENLLTHAQATTVTLITLLYDTTIHTTSSRFKQSKYILFAILTRRRLVS